MSLDDLGNKEKTCILNLDSDSSFDKKSLAKSIEIDQLEEKKSEEPAFKEAEKNKNLNENQIKNSDVSNINQENLLIKEVLKNKSNLISENKIDEANTIKEEEENLLIFEKVGDFKNLFNYSGQIVVESLTIKKNTVETDNNFFNKNSFENKMSNEAYINDAKNQNITDNESNPKTFNEDSKLVLEKTLLQKLETLDKHLSLIIHDLHLGKNFDFLIYIFARLFNPDFIASYFIFILSYEIYSNNDFFFVLKPIASTFVCLSVTLYLKKHFGRIRPDYSIKSKRIFDLRRHEKNCSMPSGDSLQAANFSIILFFYYNSAIGFFVIPFVMFARVYFYCHFISDTIVGASQGIFWSTLVYYFINLY
jgi:membrane-associated phospholipid phosphatase